MKLRIAEEERNLIGKYGKLDFDKAGELSEHTRIQFLPSSPAINGSD